MKPTRRDRLSLPENRKEAGVALSAGNRGGTGDGINLQSQEKTTCVKNILDPRVVSGGTTSRKVSIDGALADSVIKPI